MIRILMFSAVTLIAGLLSADTFERSNFERCRDGAEPCDMASLTDEERRAVEAFALGRNLRDCLDEKPTCDETKLTWEQAEALVAVHQERAQTRAAQLAASKESARNLSACVYGEPTCDMSKLTPAQLSTLRDAVEQHAMFKVLTTMAPATEPTKPAPPPTEPAQVPSQGPSRGQRFFSGLLDILSAAAEAYVEVESARAMAAAEQPIIVSGGGTVVVPNGSAVVVPSQSVIESRIDGDFEGWSGDTIFKLQNGQIWQQVNYHYRYSYKYSPKVIIFRAGSGYKMKVDGVSGEVQVKRIR